MTRTIMFVVSGISGISSAVIVIGVIHIDVGIVRMIPVIIVEGSKFIGVTKAHDSGAFSGTKPPRMVRCRAWNQLRVALLINVNVMSMSMSMSTK